VSTAAQALGAADWAGVHVIADPAAARGRSALAIAEAALRGGAQVIQVRMKGATSRALYEAAVSVARTVRRVPAARLVVNDRLDVALAVDADAVHLGQEDLAPADARAALLAAGRPLVYGISTHDLSEARAAEAQGAAYIGFGPLFATRTKVDALSPRGLDDLAEVCAAVKIPVIGIGGITIENAKAAAEAGASGLAVVSAVAGAPDMETAVRARVALFPPPSPARRP
jgi:thiamine-phosphate pyrophosphorylase